MLDFIFEIIAELLLELLVIEGYENSLDKGKPKILRLILVLLLLIFFVIVIGSMIVLAITLIINKDVSGYIILALAVTMFIMAINKLYKDLKQRKEQLQNNN